MKTSKMLFTLLSVAVLIAMLAGCAPAATPTPAADAKPYIPVISKGFQHQFWQAVKAGADQAAADLDVEITFEGPE